MFRKNTYFIFIRAVAALVGTTVGAGMFALPYLLSRFGFLVFSIILVGVGLLSTWLNQIYARVVVKTPGDHQLPGYAAIHLGEWGKFLAFFSMVSGIYGALTVYIIQGGEFLSSLVRWNQTFLSLLFWLILSSFLILGLRVASVGEIALSGGIVVLVLFIAGCAFRHFDPSNLVKVTRALTDFPVAACPTCSATRSGRATHASPLFGAGHAPQLRNFLSLLNLFAPLGVVLFAFGGTSAIPEVEEIMRAERGKLPRVISFSGDLVLILYILFALAVVGACGSATTPAALSGLGKVSGESVFLWGTALGVIALGSSYLLLGYSLREVYFRDFGISKSLAWLLVLVPPVLIALFSNLGLLSVLSVTGMIGIGLSWLLILLIYLRAK